MTATLPTRARTTATQPPYTWRRYQRTDGMWSVQVTVAATGQQLTTSYDQRPTDDDCRRIAGRLFGLRRKDSQ